MVEDEEEEGEKEEDEEEIFEGFLLVVLFGGRRKEPVAPTPLTRTTRSSFSKLLSALMTKRFVRSLSGRELMAQTSLVMANLDVARIFFSRWCCKAAKTRSLKENETHSTILLCARSPADIVAR